MATSLTRSWFVSVRCFNRSASFVNVLSRLETVGGPIDANPKEVKPGEGIGTYEAPRGEVFHYIRSDGSNRPVRHKIRAPSYMNVPTNQEAVIGETIADATIISGRRRSLLLLHRTDGSRRRPRHGQGDCRRPRVDATWLTKRPSG